VRDLIVREEVRQTSGAGKDQGGVEAKGVPVGAGPGREEVMDVDA